MNKPLLRLLGTVWLLGLLTTSGWAKEKSERLLENLPAEMAELTKGEIHDYGEADLGHSIDYKTKGLLITVYVYNLGAPKIDSGINDPVVRKAFAIAKAEVAATMKDPRYYSNGKKLVDEAIEASAGSKVLCAKYHLTRGTEFARPGWKVFSSIYVFGSQGEIFKLRVSGDVEKEETLQPKVDAFLRLLTLQLNAI